MEKATFFWFRRDLRLEDNVGLYNALETSQNVIPVFIFDSNILSELPENDARVSFIYDRLTFLDQELRKMGSSLLIRIGEPEKVWEQLITEFSAEALYTNRDYEPYALERDQKIEEICNHNGIQFRSFKDQVIFEMDEILKDDGTPYTVFTPFKNKWLSRFQMESIQPVGAISFSHFTQQQFEFPDLHAIGFKRSLIEVRDFDLSQVKKYDQIRDLPAVDGTSYLSPHLRFGTIGIRQLVAEVKSQNSVFLSELIWREFFMQILYHFPKSVHENFRAKYNEIEWRNKEEEFEKWKRGITGYPMVDAGMRQLNQTGYMHNRVRMVTASFLCKHLLIDWRWGEAYFAQKLLDYDLSANVGNWQWAAGTGCDAAPYFRVFNPTEQQKKFDPKGEYIRRWIPELEGFGYPEPMVEHKFARERALKVYKVGIEEYENQQ
ncbi:MAG: deoxyribodipyrimidine photo-lyase [Crocinitomicaceae bacterium]|nr:deoxyribodipyrimidine photo-lyase [Crocinitomicaceae bacterium]